MNLGDLAKLLIATGVALVAAGLLVLLAAHVGLGRLPGDLRWEGKHVKVYAPLATCVLVSVAATIIFNLFVRR